MKRFKRLLEPGQIGGMAVKNRMKAASVSTWYLQPDGRLTDKEINHLKEWAKGGAAMVTTGGAHVTSWGKLMPGIMAGHDDSLIPDLSRLAKAIKEEGAKAGFQTFHCGRMAWAPEETVGPSSIQPAVSRFHKPRELGIQEIKDLVEAHGKAAKRAKIAGFDYFEVCGNGGYLIASFLSPATNKRSDRYGGSLENRTRFLLEIIESVKVETGNGPLIVRICGDELVDGGNTLEELRKIAQMAQEAGMDALSVSVGWHDTRVPVITYDIPTGGWLYLAEGMKKVLKIPVLMAYRLNRAEVAEKAIADGKIDFWEMARPLFTDPQIPKKVAEGRAEDIVPCIGCCQRCMDNMFAGKPVGCILNSRMGHEGENEYEVKPASVKKKVMVVGGGPGGMEAAKVAALRGHEVSLYESKDSLGGRLFEAAVLPVKKEIGDAAECLSTQTEKAGVHVNLSSEATLSTVIDNRPDAVILAIGATPTIIDIPGATLGMVVNALDVLNGHKTVGDNVVIIGGGMVGCETAEWLASKGKKVTIIEVLASIAKNIGPTTRWTTLARLKKAGVRMETGVKVEEITDKGVNGTQKGIPVVFRGDSVVLAVGMTPLNYLAEQLKGKVPEIYTIGDCVEPRGIGEAMDEGFIIGNKI